MRSRPMGIGQRPGQAHISPPHFEAINAYEARIFDIAGVLSVPAGPFAASNPC